jgi:predicted metal-dependent HD superfamily phosphohydrolase
MDANIRFQSHSRELLRQKITEIFECKRLSFAHRDFILDSYSEPWRHYHNCDHILKMLSLLGSADRSDVSVEELNAIEMMIIYHDVIYKIVREKGWNENESVVVASRQLRACLLPPALIDVVCEGILATVDHQVPEPNWTQFIGLFLDIDMLAGLGTTWVEFAANTNKIQREYEPLYTADEYQTGRVKWAEGFIKRDKIFVTPQFEQYEVVARENLKTLIAGGR